jgi:HAD superfamily hydrolase (TIGR01457 family)
VGLAGAYDSVLFDLDGVLYRGGDPIPAAAEAVGKLRADGIGVSFVTNNSSATREEVARRLTGFGIEANPDEVASSAGATADLLARSGVRLAFVIGETGIRSALVDRGIEVLDGEPASVDAVVVGWDRSADYAKLRRASLLVQGGARLVATNADAAYPAPDGLWPGAGALLAAVVTTTGATPEIVGKPHAPLFELARESAGGTRALFVGDRLDTDIAGAAALGWDSLLVLTGVTRPRDLLASEVLPTFLASDLSALHRDGARIRPATEADVGPVERLLAEAQLDTAGVPSRLPHTFVAGPVSGDAAAASANTLMVGTVSIELHEELAHLRSLAVQADRRGASFGTLLVATAVRHARQAGAHELVLVTETAGPFFAALGLEEAGRLSALPDAFRSTAALCSESASVFRLEL